MRLDNQTWVLVADGAKALTLVNEGDAEIMNLRRVAVEEEHHARTSDLGADRPGRVHQSFSSSRSGVEQTDLHQQAESAFLRGVAHALDEAARAGRFQKLVLVAPPRALAVLRDALGRECRDALVAELGKDLTAHTILDIEKALGAWAP